jgi:hypothetical protein
MEEVIERKSIEKIDKNINDEKIEYKYIKKNLSPKIISKTYSNNKESGTK